MNNEAISEFTGGSSTGCSPSPSPSAGSLYNRNPNGNNQHPSCPRSGDEKIKQLLTQYHRDGTTNHNTLSKLLKMVHGIEISPTTVSRHLKDFGLRASKLTTWSLPESTRRQLIMDQLDKDPRS